MTRWEYKVVRLDSREGTVGNLEQHLAKLGTDGWEYAGDLAPGSINLVLLFKREAK